MMDQLREGEKGMRFYVCVGLPVVLAALALSSTGVAAESGDGCACFGLDFAGRITAGFGEAPIPSGSFALEIGVGLPELSLSAWTTLDTFLTPAPSFGSQLSASRDWLSLQFVMEHSPAGVGANVRAQAAPPSWLLHNGMPSLVAAVTADLQASLVGEEAATQLGVSPCLTIITPGLVSLLSSTLSVDVQFDSDRQHLLIPASQIRLSQDLESFIVTGSVRFAGMLASLTSANLTASFPDWGLVLTGDLTPTGSGSFFYWVSASFQWGDFYLLPTKSKQGGSVCAGGVCY